MDKKVINFDEIKATEDIMVHFNGSVQIDIWQKVTLAEMAKATTAIDKLNLPNCMTARYWYGGKILLTYFANEMDEKELNLYLAPGTTNREVCEFMTKLSLTENLRNL